MADLLRMSITAYGNIERGETDITYNRLEQIAKIFGMDVVKLLAYGDNLANIFTHSHSNIVGDNNQVFTEKDLFHQIEKLHLEVEKRDLKIEKLEADVSHYREKLEARG